MRRIPAPTRNRDCIIGIVESVLPRYGRIVFEIALQCQPLVALIYFNHPLLYAKPGLTLSATATRSPVVPCLPTTATSDTVVRFCAPVEQEGIHTWRHHGNTLEMSKFLTASLRKAEQD